MAPTFVPELHLLPANQRALWPALRPVRDQGFTLYGGTAVSLRLGHRISVVVAASLLDLMGTKLKVIQQRAEKKDYLDIHGMLQRGVRLDEGLAAGRVLYGKTFQPSEALKAMTYFEDGNLGEIPTPIREALIKASASVKQVPVLRAISSSLGLGDP